MKAKRLLSALLAAGLGLVAMTPSQDALAQKGGKGGKGAQSTPSEPPVSKKSIGLPLTGISWGQTPKQVAEAIDKVLDEDYRPLYKDVQPGVKMRALDAQLAEEKSQFRRSRIDFGKLPTGIDSTPLRGEYTYQNKEALMTLTRKGGTMHFFFIQDRLWKVISEYKLSDSSSLGKTYTEAVVKLAMLYGVPGRVLPADDKRFATEVDWKDANSHLRAIERHETAFGLAFEDNATLSNLTALRPVKPVEENGIDPAVAAAARGASADPGPPPDKKDDKKGKPKK
jgi:hypothetical protein